MCEGTCMMTRYLSLLTFTEKGVHDIGQTRQRAAQFRSSVEQAGGSVVFQYWAVGEADGCLVFEVPDEEKGASLLLKLAGLGNVRTRTMRVYDETEFARIVAGT